MKAFQDNLGDNKQEKLPGMFAYEGGKNGRSGAFRVGGGGGKCTMKSFSISQEGN